MADDIDEKFQGLNMDLLIGGPFKAAADAQVLLSKATADFINSICVNDTGDKNIKERTADFSFDRVRFDEEKNEKVTENSSLNVPLLAIVKVPALGVENVDINFEMEVKSSEAAHVTECDSAEKLKFGVDAFRTDISAKVDGSTHEEHNRVADKSVKYHVQVREGQKTVPEGLVRVMDILESSVKINK